MRGIGFSLKGLFVGVTLTGVGVFALLNASPVWVKVLISLTLLVLFAALLALACRPSPRRAFWFGFSIFGLGYLLLADTPIGESYRSILPTHAALAKLHEAISREVDVATFEGNIPEGTRREMIRNESGTLIAISQFAILPSEPHFLRIGHCLWAWLFALVGGFLARYFYLAQGQKAASPGDT